MPILETITLGVAVTSAVSSAARWFKDAPVRRVQAELKALVQEASEAALKRRALLYQMTSERVSHVRTLGSASVKRRRKLEGSASPMTRSADEAELDRLIEEARGLKITNYGVFDSSVTLVSFGSLGLQLMDGNGAVPFLHEHISEILSQMGVADAADTAHGLGVLDLSLGDFLGALGLAWSIFRIGHNVRRMLESDNRLEVLAAKKVLVNDATIKIDELAQAAAAQRHELNEAAYGLFKATWIAEGSRKWAPRQRESFLKRWQAIEAAFWLQVDRARAMEA